METLLATYVHHLDPFAIQFTESFGIRWYGLAYVAGFVAAFALLRWFVKIGASELREDQVADFITIAAVLGVMVGGRLGFMLLYEFEHFVRNPLSFFNVLGGGMASHGGIAGLMIATAIYAKVTKKSWPGLGDNLCTVAPLGIFFGRLANFVNGELYGRATESSWAIKFPGEMHEVVERDGVRVWLFPLEKLREFAQGAREVAPDLTTHVENLITTVRAAGGDPHHAVVEWIIAASRENPALREQLGTILTPRHPSQLYEAAVEGLFLFLILLAIRLRWKNLYHGVLTGVFFVLYAIGRIAVENLREPDSSLIGPMTRGQFYSIFMIFVGIGFLVYAFRAKRTNRLPEPVKG